VQAAAPPVDDPASSVDDPSSPVDDRAPLGDEPAPAPDLPGLLANRLMADRMPTGLFLSSAYFRHSVTDEENTNWSAPLGRPGAVRIVYVLPTRNGQGLPDQERLRVNLSPNYRALHWRSPHIHGVEFAELDSFDMCGLSAMIYSKVPHRRIRYIIGPTSKGREMLHKSCNAPLTFGESLCIYNEEEGLTWLLSNFVLNNLLDLIVYCYHDRKDNIENTAELRVLPYLGKGAVSHWARDPEHVYARCISEHSNQSQDLITGRLMTSRLMRQRQSLRMIDLIFETQYQTPQKLWMDVMTSQEYPHPRWRTC